MCDSPVFAPQLIENTYTEHGHIKKKGADFMKKIMLFLLFFVSLLVFPAFAEEDHEHRWTVGHNEQYHWGTCLICGEEYPPEEHYISCVSTGEECAACGLSAADGAIFAGTAHYFDQNTWDYDEYTHFHLCSRCGTHIYAEEHATTCQSPDACRICGAKTADGAVMADYQHNWRIQGDNLNHWDICAWCGESTEPEPHYIDCTASGKDVCSYCGAAEANGAVIENIMHYYDGSEQQHDAVSHWFICAKCGREIMKKAHYALCTAPGVCADCGTPCGDEVLHVNHDLSAYSIYDADHHQFVCENCHQQVLGAHNYVDGFCSYCGSPEPAPIVPPAYHLTDVTYDGRILSGRLVQTAGSVQADSPIIRVTFFITGNYYMSTTCEAESDGSFLVEAVGPIEFISLSAYRIERVSDTGAEERTVYAVGGFEIR